MVVYLPTFFVDFNGHLGGKLYNRPMGSHIHEW